MNKKNDASLSAQQASIKLLFSLMALPSTFLSTKGKKKKQGYKWPSMVFWLEESSSHLTSFLTRDCIDSIVCIYKSLFYKDKYQQVFHGV
jgi:hypothetical protein